MTLDRRMLAGMLHLAGTYRFHVSEVAGGSHSSNSRHYAGVAFDVTQIDGVPVHAGAAHWQQFLHDGRAAGATEALGPGAPGHATHVHLAWPRPGASAASDAAELEHTEPDYCDHA